MPFNPKNIKIKVDACYKTLYLRQELVDAVEKIAQENDTSFNSVVVSMIEQCLEDIQSEEALREEKP